MYKGFHVKRQLLLSDFNQIEYFDAFSKNTQLPNLIKIRPIGAELFHADRRRDMRDGANSLFSKILRTRLQSC